MNSLLFWIISLVVQQPPVILFTLTKFHASKSNVNLEEVELMLKEAPKIEEWKITDEKINPCGVLNPHKKDHYLRIKHSIFSDMGITVEMKKLPTDHLHVVEFQRIPGGRKVKMFRCLCAKESLQKHPKTSGILKKPSVFPTASLKPHHLLSLRESFCIDRMNDTLRKELTRHHVPTQHSKRVQRTRRASPPIPIAFSSSSSESDENQEYYNREKNDLHESMNDIWGKIQRENKKPHRVHNVTGSVKVKTVKNVPYGQRAYQMSGVINSSSAKTANNAPQRLNYMHKDADSLNTNIYSDREAVNHNQYHTPYGQLDNYQSNQMSNSMDSLPTEISAIDLYDDQELNHMPNVVNSLNTDISFNSKQDDRRKSHIHFGPHDNHKLNKIPSFAHSLSTEVDTMGSPDDHYSNHMLSGADSISTDINFSVQNKNHKQNYMPYDSHNNYMLNQVLSFADSSNTEINTDVPHDNQSKFSVPDTINSEINSNFQSNNQKQYNRPYGQYDNHKLIQMPSVANSLNTETDTLVPEEDLKLDYMPSVADSLNSDIYSNAEHEGRKKYYVPYGKNDNYKLHKMPSVADSLSTETNTDVPYDNQNLNHMSSVPDSINIDNLNLEENHSKKYHISPDGHYDNHKLESMSSIANSLNTETDTIVPDNDQKLNHMPSVADSINLEINSNFQQDNQNLHNMAYGQYNNSKLNQMPNHANSLNTETDTDVPKDDQKLNHIPSITNSINTDIYSIAEHDKQRKYYMPFGQNNNYKLDQMPSIAGSLSTTESNTNIPYYDQTLNPMPSVTDSKNMHTKINLEQKNHHTAYGKYNMHKLNAMPSVSSLNTETNTIVPDNDQMFNHMPSVADSINSEINSNFQQDNQKPYNMLYRQHNYSKLSQMPSVANSLNTEIDTDIPENDQKLNHMPSVADSLNSDIYSNAEHDGNRPYYEPYGQHNTYKQNHMPSHSLYTKTDANILNDDQKLNHKVSIAESVNTDIYSQAEQDSQRQSNLPWGHHNKHKLKQMTTVADSLSMESNTNVPYNTQGLNHMSSFADSINTDINSNMEQDNQNKLHIPYGQNDNHKLHLMPGAANSFNRETDNKISEDDEKLNHIDSVADSLKTNIYSNTEHVAHRKHYMYYDQHENYKQNQMPSVDTSLSTESDTIVPHDNQSLNHMASVDDSINTGISDQHNYHKHTPYYQHDNHKLNQMPSIANSISTENDTIVPYDIGFNRPHIGNRLNANINSNVQNINHKQNHNNFTLHEGRKVNWKSNVPDSINTKYNTMFPGDDQNSNHMLSISSSLNTDIYPNNQPDNCNQYRVPHGQHKNSKLNGKLSIDTVSINTETDTMVPYDDQSLNHMPSVGRSLNTNIYSSVKSNNHKQCRGPYGQHNNLKLKQKHSVADSVNTESDIMVPYDDQCSNNGISVASSSRTNNYSHDQPDSHNRKLNQKPFVAESIGRRTDTNAPYNNKKLNHMPSVGDSSSTSIHSNTKPNIYMQYQVPYMQHDKPRLHQMPQQVDSKLFHSGSDADSSVTGSDRVISKYNQRSHQMLPNFTDSSNSSIYSNIPHNNHKQHHVPRGQHSNQRPHQMPQYDNHRHYQIPHVQYVDQQVHQMSKVADSLHTETDTNSVEYHRNNHSPKEFNHLDGYDSSDNDDRTSFIHFSRGVAGENSFFLYAQNPDSSKKTYHVVAHLVYEVLPDTD